MIGHFTSKCVRYAVNKALPLLTKCSDGEEDERTLREPSAGDTTGSPPAPVKQQDVRRAAPAATDRHRAEAEAAASPAARADDTLSTSSLHLTNPPGL